MTGKRAAAYSGGVLLLLAWLASAAGLVRQRPTPEQTAQPVETAGTTLLAADVQAQTARLKSRLASAPSPQNPVRNPFAFAEKETTSKRARSAPIEPAAPPPVLEPAEPAIDLVGVAEDTTPTGIVRTAIISALSGELFLVKEGELIAGRYRVKTVGTNSVELNDQLSGSVRRLTLRE
jgi:hypothetical protein